MSEDALRHAVESGQGFYSADETEAASRWALGEIESLRQHLRGAERYLTDALTMLDGGSARSARAYVISALVDLRRHSDRV